MLIKLLKPADCKTIALQVAAMFGKKNGWVAVKDSALVFCGSC